jgi:hypothetical protein
MRLGLPMRGRKAARVSLMRHAVRAAFRLSLVDAAELSLLSSADGKDLGQRERRGCQDLIYIVLLPDPPCENPMPVSHGHPL